MGNMYGDSIYQWNICVGCEFNCRYCLKSFQRQMKRQKHRCMRCYKYEPHFHPSRLKNSLPRTEGDEFIWVCSSGDISFLKEEWMNQILEKLKEYPDRTFFFQTKDPSCFQKYEFTENIILGITLETNRNRGYRRVSEAPKPNERVKAFKKVRHLKKAITIEPILNFDLTHMLDICCDLTPERIYIGYDTKDCMLDEPALFETKQLISNLRKLLPECKVKTKLIRKAFWEGNEKITKYMEVQE